MSLHRITDLGELDIEMTATPGYIEWTTGLAPVAIFGRKWPQPFRWPGCPVPIDVDRCAPTLEMLLEHLGIDWQALVRALARKGRYADAMAVLGECEPECFWDFAGKEG